MPCTRSARRLIAAIAAVASAVLVCAAVRNSPGLATYVRDAVATTYQGGVGGPVSGQFTVRGADIIGPDGNDFVPVGANVNGPQFVWNGPTIGQANVARDVWHWNTIRLNTCWAGGCENGGGWNWPTNDDLDAIMAEYTDAGIVVMIGLQQFMPGQFPSAPELTSIQAWWTDVANRYADNPYVWFNLLNEPGQGGLPAVAQWKSVTATLAQAIRSTGSTNIIVADGTQYGQEAYEWGCGEIPYANSAILTHGPALQSSYGNIAFSLHVYSEWGGGSTGCTDSQLDRRLMQFIDRVHRQSLPLLIGETGASPQESWEQRWEKGQTAAAQSAFRVAPGRGVGVLPWHGDRGAGYLLAYSGNWSDVTGRSELTWLGRALWDYAHTVNP